jgi:hypothetical protein
MTEITQADRDAALMNVLWPILGGNHTDAETWNKIADAIEADRAAVREQAERETVEKIVAWLRDQDGHGYDDVRANCIEAGEWKQ